MTDIGKLGEQLVAEHYQKLGYKIIRKNFIQSKGKQMGELDLIVAKDKQIIFVEVKTRSNSAFGSGVESVDFYKQRKLVKTAKLFLAANPSYQDYDFQIDVAEVEIDKNPPSVIILSNVIEDLD